MDRRFVSCYDGWIHFQKSDLRELLDASASPGTTDAELRAIISRSMQHYEEYCEQRRVLAQEDGPTFFSPPWCASFENSVLWIGGCRASLAIRLLYSVIGSEMDDHLEEFLRGQQGRLASMGMMGLTACQLQMVNDLHQRTLCAEDRLSSRLATIQEDVADKPLLPLIRRQQEDGTINSFASTSSSTVHVNDGDHIDGEVEMAMKTYAEGLGRLVAEADRLRVSTVRSLLTEILSPRQAVELLVTGKQLHLSLHELALKRDRQLGRG
ncbi:hypothetical protein LUZ60_001120 [Juncus effusus]|nr:hypothetical protein LUZ60_001120 [Juncus effusus]